MTTLVAPRLSISASGAMRVAIDGADAPLSSKKALAILVYLAVQPSRTESRERIAALLWSDSGPDQARGALRQTLRRLKSDLGPAGDLLEADRSALRLVQPVELDVLQAIDAAGRGEAPGALGQKDSDLSRLFVELEGLDRDFDLWVAVQRERLTSQLVARLEAAMRAAETEPHRLALAEALMRIDPTHEGACRAAMRAQLALGDTAQAMRTYERLWKALEDELDVEPSEKTQALYVSIKQGGHGAPRDAAAPSRTAEAPEAAELVAPIAIVVEPEPASELPEAFRYIAQTFRHEMVGALSRFRDWMVIDGPRNGSSPPTYRVYDLRVSMHHLQGAITVAMSLTDRALGRCIWSERQVAALDELARLQRTALRNLALALNVHLSTPRLQTARDTGGPMGRNYELWMQAQALTTEWRAESEDRANAILRDLVATAPNFAPAMVALAQQINVRPIIYPGARRDPARLRESLSISARAVTVDPLDSRAHLCRYWSYAMSGQHGPALAHLELALDLNENDPWTIISAAVGFAFAGEIPRAVDLVDQARAFGMRHSRAAQGYIATALYLCGDYAGAEAAAEVAGDAMIDQPGWAAAGYIRLGKRDEAAQAMDMFLASTFENWFGDPPATEAKAIDWFVESFPIRLPEVAADLRAALVEAAAERKKRRP